MQEKETRQERENRTHKKMKKKKPTAKKLRKVSKNSQLTYKNNFSRYCRILCVDFRKGLYKR